MSLFSQMSRLRIVSEPSEDTGVSELEVSCVGSFDSVDASASCSDITRVFSLGCDFIVVSIAEAAAVVTNWSSCA